MGSSAKAPSVGRLSVHPILQGGGRAHRRACAEKSIPVKRYASIFASAVLLLGLGGTTTIAGAAAAAVSPPRGVTAIASDNSVILAWQARANASGYVVYRGTTTKTVSTAISSTITSTTFTDSTAKNGTTYFYAVRSVSNGSTGPASSLAQATPQARYCSSGNAIVVENCFPGTTQWKTKAPFDAAHGGIEGFLGATSINAGESVSLYVNTDTGVPYHVEIYRVGYYGGSEARLISVLPNLTGVAQPACTSDVSTGLVDCSNWTATSTLTTTPDWPSGVYLLRLVRENNNADNEMLLVVRHDADTSDIAYTVPVTTYQAYNNYGGKSLYDFNSFGSNTVSGSQRAVKVSFDRPFENSVQNVPNWFTNSDIQNVSGLEQQGYNIRYTSSLDLQTGAARLTTAKVYVSPSHDEYWSSEMRTTVTNALASGVSLLYLGSNADYWKIRFEASPYSGVANRVEVCYKTTQGGPVDPSGIPTGTWRDPNGANQPENALIGQMYIGDNDFVFFPLQVDAAQGLNRVWRYTTLAALPAGSTATIGNNLVGWEWDGRFNNGAEPPGVATVASSSVNGELLTDAGKTYVNGSTSGTATEYKASSGAWVFATGTNQWSRGLGYNIDGIGEPSTLIQQATMNVLGDMHVRPTTPSAGLTADALGAPSVTRITPASGATGVPNTTSVTATFDKPIDPSTVTAQTLTVAGPDGNPVAATVTFDRASNTATLVPQAPLHSGTTYTITVSTGVTTWAGTGLAQAATYSFTTQAFVVTSASPAAGATNVGSLATVSASFSAPLDPSTVTTQSLTLTAPDGTSVAGSVAYNSATYTATFTPTQPLKSGATYSATVTTAIAGTNGSTLQTPLTWSFTVANCPCSLMSNLSPANVGLPVQDGRVGSGPWSYELGTKIQVSSGAQLTAIRFYKDSNETGAHVGRVWDSSGNLLTQVTFTNETATGWQAQSLPTPLTLVPGKTYIVSVGFNAYFVDTPAGLQSALTNGPVATVTDGANGVFASQAGSFPTQTYNSTNYFVDAVVQ
jgi:Domain of unknown function (DUF4082)/Bacterial Ig-like domain